MEKMHKARYGEKDSELSGHTTFPAPPWVQPPAPLPSPEIWVRWKAPCLSSPGWYVPLATRTHPEGSRSPQTSVTSLAYRKTSITLKISRVFRSCQELFLGAGQGKRGRWAKIKYLFLIMSQHGCVPMKLQLWKFESHIVLMYCEIFF